MRKATATILLSSLLAGCAGGGVGPLGLGAVLGNRNLASAEPMFGKKDDKCVNSPGELLTALYAPVAAHEPQSGKRSKKIPPLPKSNCAELFSAVHAVIPTRIAGAHGDFSSTSYTMPQRNEIIDALLASSNRKCGRYEAFLKNADGISNVTLSLGAIITGGLGAFVGGPLTAKALSGSAAILSGSRSAINEVYLTNQTIHVLAAAFEKARIRQRAVITNRQACSVEKYTLTRGIEDAFEYHNSCSLVKGLQETVLAVERSDNPGLDAMRKTFAEYAMLVKQASEIEGKSTPTPVAGPVAPLDLSVLVDLDTKQKKAVTDVVTATAATAREKLAMEKAEQAVAAEPDAAKKVPLATAYTKAKTAYDEAVTTQKEATWKREGLDRDVKAAAQRLASAATAATANVSPETRACPFDVTATGQQGTTS